MSSVLLGARHRGRAESLNSCPNRQGWPPAGRGVSYSPGRRRRQPSQEAHGNGRPGGASGAWGAAVGSQCQACQAVHPSGSWRLEGPPRLPEPKPLRNHRPNECTFPTPRERGRHGGPRASRPARDSARRQGTRWVTCPELPSGRGPRPTGQQSQPSGCPPVCPGLVPAPNGCSRPPSQGSDKGMAPARQGRGRVQGRSGGMALLHGQPRQGPISGPRPRSSHRQLPPGGQAGPLLPGPQRPHSTHCPALEATDPGPGQGAGGGDCLCALPHFPHDHSR